MLIRKAFRYRIYPTSDQERRLVAWQDALRWLWNLAHEQRLHALSRVKHHRRYLTAFDQINELTPLRKEAPWLRDVPRNVSAQVLVELDKAWQRCFKKLGRQPRWKKKGRHSVTLCEPHRKLFRLEGSDLVFPKLGKVKAVVHRPLEGNPKTCTITQDGDQWFASISCEVEIEDPKRPSGAAVAIDRGVVNLIADNNGRKVENPRWLNEKRKALARAQRVVCRRKKGSKNREKAKKRVARLHRKVRRQRDHVLHCEAKHYANSHGTVIVEKLQIQNMTRSARGSIESPGNRVRQKAGLNRAILDGGWYRFFSSLRGRVEWHCAVGGRAPSQLADLLGLRLC